MAENHRTCKTCGIGFASAFRGTKTCSRTCALKLMSAIKSAKSPEIRCAGCGVNFRAPASLKRKFCTRECCFAFETALTNKRKADKRAASAAASAASKIRPCCICSQPASVKCCSDACWRELKRQRARKSAVDAHVAKQRMCVECNGMFAAAYGSKRRRFCSAACSTRQASRIGKATRRARRKQAAREPIDPIRIFERDQWRCHICKVATPKRLRGTQRPNAPELDHILPLAMGGAHTNDNVACCCRSCNSSKGARPFGQMRIALDFAPA